MGLNVGCQQGIVKSFTQESTKNFS